MGKIDLYYHPFSSPSRAVQMTATNLGIELNIKVVDLIKGEHLKPEFLKINPQHTVPVIDDNGFCLTESRAIIQYLANGYAKDDTLYPKVTKKRAIVDQRLYFDMGTLNKSFVEAYIPSILGDAPLDDAKMKKFDDALELLEGFLEQTKYAAGDGLTLADFSIMATLATAQAFAHDFGTVKLVQAYMKRCKDEIKGYAENEAGAKEFGDFARPKLGR